MTPYSTISLTASSLLLLLWGSVAQQHAVLDVDGDELLVGRDYVISSTYRGAAGGYLSLRPGTCPQPVIQTLSDRQPGLPVSFWPASGARGGPVNVSANLDIQFIIDAATWAQCDANPVWMVGTDSWTGIGFVQTGGELGPNKDPEYWFRIEPYESNYKLSYCWACEICETMPCRDLSIRMDVHGRRLALALPIPIPIERPFEVVFWKGCWGNEGARTNKMSTDN
ncbi:Kunitz family trypsin and protease inhibitor protein [Striga hermonthica]|uniref:Kunitz family trypsin and protease inhibitor protein n=1 Tax=Striga hermonthica TaxID=68872 RepID=A0A9N7MJZ6_STRHE|nr:Kunitz family trypsin and protease inhibitor protein [Striga hermonthica]